jgi:hypothetical protein
MPQMLAQLQTLAIGLSSNESVDQKKLKHGITTLENNIEQRKFKADIEGTVVSLVFPDFEVVMGCINSGFKDGVNEQHLRNTYDIVVADVTRTLKAANKTDIPAEDDQEMRIPKTPIKQSIATEPRVTGPQNTMNLAPIESGSTQAHTFDLQSADVNTERSLASNLVKKPARTASEISSSAKETDLGARKRAISKVNFTPYKQV